MTHLLGKPLLRVFPELRGITQLESGWGLNIVPPPERDDLEVSAVSPWNALLAVGAE